MKTILDFRLHHIGIVVPEIESHSYFYTSVLQYRDRTPVIHDPIQTAFVKFFSIPGSDHYLELVAPDSAASKLASAALKNLPLNHLCYSCENIYKAIEDLKRFGCLILQDPLPAVAFDGRRIAWSTNQNRLLIELVERAPGGEF